MAASDLCLSKTPLGETGCQGNPYFLLTGCIGIQFFDSPPFSPTQSVRPPLVHYPSLCSTCVTYGTLCHANGHHVLPTQPLSREVQDFLGGERHFKHVHSLTYYISNLPLTKRGILVGSTYVPKSPWSKCSTVMELAFHWFWTCIPKSPMCW